MDVLKEYGSYINGIDLNFKRVLDKSKSLGLINDEVHLRHCRYCLSLLVQTARSQGWEHIRRENRINTTGYQVLEITKSKIQDKKALNKR